jgi:serine/threonine-protein kinase HipA
LRALIQRIADAYGMVEAPLPKDLRELLDARLAHNIQVLRG